MPPIDAILAVVLAGFALSATPGPSMLYVLSRSVGQSRTAGLASALGLALGGIILAVATALGLAAIFAKFPWLVVALRYVGSAYLIWLGIGMIRKARANSHTTFAVDSVTRKSFGTVIWQGILVEVLNPKTVLFFALFLPPFVNMNGGLLSAGDIQFQLLALGVLIPLTAIPSDVLIAYMGGSMTLAINQSQAFREYLAWAGGFILIGIALNLHIGIL